MVPVELSVKTTVNGHDPLVGLPVKLDTGTRAPVPVTGLVMLPVGLVNVTKFVKVPMLAGENLSTRFVEPNPDSVNGVPEMIVKGPVSTDAVPLLRVDPP